MIGFLLHLSFNRSPTEYFQSSSPFTGEELRRLHFSPGIELVITNNRQGDIHIAYEKENSILVLSGYISETPISLHCSSQQEICDQLRCHIDQNPSQDTLSNLASSLYGSFALTYVSIKEQQIWTITDRVASRPLWFQKNKYNLRVSSHAVAIARHMGSPTIALGSLASYLVYATQVEPSHSLFSEILCQKEGSILHFDADQTKPATRWYRFQHTPDDRQSVSSWVDLTANRFREAASRLLKTTAKPLLFLSGGVDSRIAGAALTSAGASPLLCTLGDSLNLEIKVAKVVAATLHSPHIIKLRDDEWYLRGISKAMFHSHGSFSWNHSHFSEIYASLQVSHQVDAALLGDFCEAFSKLFCSIQPDQDKPVWSPTEFYNEFDQLPQQNYRPVNKDATLALLQEDVRRLALASLKENILSRYDEASTVSTDPLIVGDYFFRWQTASCLPTFQMLNDVRSAGPERNLMFDKDLHQLLEIMPARIRCQSNLGAKVVNKLCPKAAWVPNANTLIPLPAPQAAHKFAKVIRPKLGKIRRALFSNTYKTTASWPHLPLLYAGHPVWRKHIQERIFDKNLLPQELYDHKAITACWNDFCRGDLSRHADVERLLGLAELSMALQHN